MWNRRRLDRVVGGEDSRSSSYTPAPGDVPGLAVRGQAGPISGSERPGHRAPPMRLPSQQRRLRRWTAVALVLVIIGIGGLVVIRLRQPMEAVVTPVADAYVSTAHRDANYGTEPTLRADATPKIRSYLRFRLPESGRIVRAELRLWSRSGDLAGYSVHPVTS